MSDYIVTKDFPGSPDGCQVVYYKKGQVARPEEMGEGLFQVALGEKWIKKQPSRSTAADKSRDNAAGEAQ